jgi:diguanylate cyclase (GGDEF)-like protein
MRNRLLKAPDARARETRFSQVLHHIYQLGLLLHVAFFVLFTLLEIWPLSALNLLSIGIYLLALIVNHGPRWLTALGVVYIEVIFHAVAVTELLGWATGFHYYLLAVGPVILLNGHWPLGTRLVLSLFPIAILAAMYLHTLDAPIAALGAALPDEVIHLVNIGNQAAVYLTLGFITYTYGLMARRAESRLIAATADWERKAHLDMLTGIYNRRAIDERVTREASRASRHGESFALALVDIDDFKAINDSHGHGVGDAVIREIAQRIQANIRDHDAVGRWGGEEFLVLLTRADDRVTPGILETLRSKISGEGGEGLPEYTVTIGSAIFAPGDGVAATIAQADAALYRGKKLGKNRVIHAHH